VHSKRAAGQALTHAFAMLRPADCAGDGCGSRAYAARRKRKRLAVRAVSANGARAALMEWVEVTASTANRS
jgi:hypothetical protein